MSDLPKRVHLQEVGPREGFQFEKTFIQTADKVKLIDALSQTGLGAIEVTSFVSPKWVPQMADAEEVANRFKRKPGVRYAAVYLNQRGLERAKANGKLDIAGVLRIIVSNEFSKRNSNKTLEESIAEIPTWLDWYRQNDVPVAEAGILTAFGCNFEGEIPLSKVLSVVERVLEIGKARGVTFERIRLSDTMGWANPEQLKRTVAAIRERHPDQAVWLHLHDTRGMGMANIYAALQMGIDHLDTSIGGMGGCPFAAHKAAAGNLPTEDVALLCEEMGIETGIDLEKLIEAARLAEETVGHPLVGKVMNGGLPPRHK
ncbi:MAG: hydroxymethylglutaryl-CoA lyase [Chloroflexi bacterium]|nr:hydroxymethylglutaryl-CoA lyase [Chloroflexota bacterium]